MMIALSGNTPVAAAAPSAPPSAPVAAAAPSAVDRTTAPDTVNLSAAGRQASQDVDHDGDSH
jgi:hypothetical protein